MKEASRPGYLRLSDSFTSSRPLLIGYVPLGDPRFSSDILDCYVQGGVDILEIGLPSLDPYGDGETMANSMRLAAQAGVNGDAILELLRPWLTANEQRPPIVWMCYADADLTNLEQWAAEGAVDGILMLGPPPEGLAELANGAGLGLCEFLSWEPSVDEIDRASVATGYVMVPARPGVTGTDKRPGDPAKLVAQARSLNPTAPVVVGFGINDATTAVRLANSGVDGVVVGTACVQALETEGEEGLTRILTEISSAMRRSEK